MAASLIMSLGGLTAAGSQEPATAQAPHGAEHDECREGCDTRGVEYSDAPTIQPEPLGGLAPRETSDIRLRRASVDVRLRLRDGALLKRELVSRYVLSNPGREQRLRVGFRFSFGSNVDRVDWPPPRNRMRQEARASLNGSPIRCEALEGIGWSSTPRPSTAEGWCEFTIEVPAGESTWTFAGTADTGTSTLWVVPAFRYPLSAEAVWPGPVEGVTLDATIENWAGPIAVLSPGARAVGTGHLQWRLEAPDFTRVRGIAFYLPRGTGTSERDAQGVPDLITHTARASTTLPPQGRFRFDPAFAIDADHQSAWCEGAPGAGLGQWNEVTVALGSRPAAQCRVLAFGIIPGYAHSRSTWLQNERIQRLRISRCGTPADGLDIVLGPESTSGLDRPRLANDPWHALLMADAPSRWSGDGRPGAGAHCYRLTILEVAKGASEPDACVSEFLPILACD